MQTLDFEPGAKTLELFRARPEVLLYWLDWWWREAGEIMADIEEGNHPKPAKGFALVARHISLWCDAKLKLEAEPLLRLHHQLNARATNQCCPCGGEGVTYCPRCNSDIAPGLHWAPLDTMHQTCAQAQVFVQRLSSVTSACCRSPYLGITLGDREASREWNGKHYGTVEFGKAEKLWQLFTILVSSRETGIHRRELEDQLGQVDHSKRRLLELLQPLKLDITKGMWKLKHVGMDDR